MIMVVSTLWKLYDMVITARMKVCARVDPSMSTASKGVDARHNLHVAVDIVALRASRGESQLQCVKDLERGFPTCERNDVALSHGGEPHLPATGKTLRSRAGLGLGGVGGGGMPPLVTLAAPAELS